MRTITILVNSSEQQTSTTSAAISLYNNSTFKMLHKHLSVSNAQIHVLVLSPLYGIVSASDSLEPYDTHIDHIDTNRLVNRTKKTSLQTLKSASGELYVMLSTKYMMVWDIYKQCLPNNTLNRFDCIYESRSHRCKLEYQNRLNMILENADTACTPSIIRSGIANIGECRGYLGASNHIGISLARVNFDDKSHRNFEVLFNAIEAVNTGKTKLFVDNGLITLLNSSGGSSAQIDAQWVFNQFDQLTKHIKPEFRHNLLCVIPDATDCYDEAKAILIDNRTAIHSLMDKGVKMVLPFHKQKGVEKISEHATECADILGFHHNLVAGIPTLKIPSKRGKPTIDLRLPPEQIEQIYQTKVNGNALFTEAHHLGMSDVSYKSVKQIRTALARMYSVTLTMDACRTAAIFSNGSAGVRLSEEISIKHKSDVQSKYTYSDIMSSTHVDNHNYDVENQDGNSSTLVMSGFYDLLETETAMWYCIWNLIMPNLEVKYSNFTDNEEAIEHAWQLLSYSPSVERELFQHLKHWYHENFRSSMQYEPLSSNAKREKVIVQLFTKPKLLTNAA